MTEKEIWVIRHAESRSNAGEITSNIAGIELSEKGMQQRMAVPDLITDEPELIVATHHIRTQITSEPTRQKYPNARYEIWNLHEFTMLSPQQYDNKTTMERRPAVEKYWRDADPDYLDGPGAESFSMMVDRVKADFVKIQQAPENFIVIFSHGRIMQTMRFLLERPFLSNKEMMKQVFAYSEYNAIDNCAVLRLTANEMGLKLHEEDRAHFEAGFKLAD